MATAIGEEFRAKYGEPVWWCKIDLEPMAWKAARVGAGFAISPKPYKAWKQVIVPLIQTIKPKVPLDVPLAMAALFVCRLKLKQHVPDLTNMTKAIEDAMQTAGVLVNDQLIAEHRTQRLVYESEEIMNGWSEIALWRSSILPIPRYNKAKRKS